MNPQYLSYLAKLVKEYHRLTGYSYTVDELLTELSARTVHYLETSVTCALFMELRAGILSPTIVINNATEHNEAQAAPDPLGR